MKEQRFVLSGEVKITLLGTVLASFCIKGCLIYLYGCVGTGKSVFCRGFIRALGYTGSISSPTYTLIESYMVKDWYIHHFDCYRLNSSEELEIIGIRDFFDGNAVCLVEWPKKNLKILPTEDISIIINYHSVHVNCREVIIKSVSEIGYKMLLDLSSYWKLFK